MANITTYLNNIKNAMFGKDVRDSIHDAIKQCYDDASTNGNANMEVTLARGEYNNLNERLDNHSSQIKENEKNFNEQLDTIENKYLFTEGLLSFPFGYNIITGDYVNGTITNYSVEQLLAYAKKLSDAGIKKAILQVFIKWNSYDNSLSIATDLDVLKSFIEQEKNIKEFVIKVHGLNYASKDITATITRELFMTNYKPLVYRIADTFANMSKVKQLVYINEAHVLLTENNSAHDTFYSECSNYIKSKGFECGITIASTRYNVINNSAFDNVDFIGINCYPNMSAKMEKTTLDDCIQAWKESDIYKLADKIKRDYPNKKLILSESGCQRWWICLMRPGTWTIPESVQADSNGIANTLMLESCFKVFNHTSIIDELWWYYDEYSFNYKIFNDKLKYYLTGEVVK